MIRLLVFGLLVVAGTSRTFARLKNGSITGVVSDAHTRETLIGCMVWLQGASQVVTTNLDGKFTLGGVTPGNYQVNSASQRQGKTQAYTTLHTKITS